MQEKVCFACQMAKPLAEFYVHQMMADGHLNKCKACVKLYTNSRRREMPEHVRAIDNARKSSERRAYRVAKHREHNLNNPAKAIARNAVANALRDCRLFRKPCEKCANPKSEAHHPDYSKPLDVMWLCRRCHRIEHGTLVDAPQTA